MPIHGGWYDQCGITYTARRAYYQKLREIGARYHAPVVDFADHDADQSFCHDTMGHLAPSGLVYYSQVLDGFFHDAIPRPVPSSPGRRNPWRRRGEPIDPGKKESHESCRSTSQISCPVEQWFAQPWVRFVALTIYYLGILVGLVALYGQGDFSTPPFIYQNF